MKTSQKSFSIVDAFKKENEHQDRLSRDARATCRRNLRKFMWFGHGSAESPGGTYLVSNPVNNQKQLLVVVTQQN